MRARLPVIRAHATYGNGVKGSWNFVEFKAFAGYAYPEAVWLQ